MNPTVRTIFFAEGGALRNGWRLLNFLLLLNLLGIATSPLIQAWPRAWQGLLPGRWLDVALIVLVSWACLRLDRRPLATLGLARDRAFARDLLWGTLGGAALIVTTALLVRGTGAFHWVATPGTGAGDLTASAWFFLAVAAWEELAFRGYPFQRTRDGLGLAAAQLLFALVFAVGHWRNPGMAGATKAWASLNIGLAAILLGFCYQRTGSLALPIGVHLGWNWVQGPLLGFGVSGTTAGPSLWTPVLHGRPEWLTGGAFGLEASAVCTLVCGLAILGLWRWRGTAPTGGASTASGS